MLEDVLTRLRRSSRGSLALLLALAPFGCTTKADTSPPPSPPSPPAATCSDGSLNGAETGVDCGGGTCPACAPGQACAHGSDCLSGECSGTCQAPVGCLAAEVCGNTRDDDCNGQTDETGCVETNTYLADWKKFGQVVDYVIFGDYPLYTKTQEGRSLTRQTWGSACVGQTSSTTPQEESTYCLGSTSDFLEWNMHVPSDGAYVLMLAEVHGTITNNNLQFDDGRGVQVLPPIVSAQRKVLLDYNIGPPKGVVFYVLDLKAGDTRFRISGARTFFFVNTAVLGHLKEVDHYYPNPVYPHLHFTQAQIDAILAAPSSQAQQKILTPLTADATRQMSVTDLVARGRDREGVLEALAYSGVFNRNAQHMARAIELFTQLVTWLGAQDGNYVTGDILEYGYDMRRLGVVYDLIHNDMTEAQRRGVREIMSQEMMRHALSNAAGNWWRLPRAGGWTVSHGQGGQLGLALYFDDKFAKFYFDISLMMGKTSLDGNVTIDGAYLQALGDYYGWDLSNLMYFLNGMKNNPSVSVEDLWEYSNQALRRYTRWLLYSFAPTRHCMGPFGTSGCRSLYYGTTASMLLLAADHYQDGKIQWLYDAMTGTSGVAVLGYPRVETLGLFNAVTRTAPVDPAGELPLGAVTRQNEHVYMRTGWGNKDIAYMTRCGLAANHSQREHGNLILYADGHNYLQAYNAYNDGDPMGANTAKNFVLIDGKGQGLPPNLTTRMGAVTAFVHSGSADYQNCDNSYAYNIHPSDPTSQTVDYSTRQVVFVRPDANAGGYFLVFDHIKATGAANHRYEFALHAGCDRQTGNGAGDCHDAVTIAANGAGAFSLHAPNSNQSLAVRFVEPVPAEVQYALQPMPITSFPDYLRVSRAATGARGEFAAVLFPEDPGAAPPRLAPTVSRLDPGTNQVGVLLTSASGTDTVLWSEDGSPLSLGGIVSDARVVVIRTEGSQKFGAMFEGRALESGGVRYLEASGVTNGVWRRTATGVEVTVGNEVSAASVGVTVGGLLANAQYGYSLNGAAQAAVTSDASGHVTLTGLPGPKSVVALVHP